MEEIKLSVLTVLIIIFVSVFCLVPSARADGDYLLNMLSDAQGNIELGELKIHPGADVQEYYNDNIYHRSESEIEDIITTVTPGLFLSIGDDYKFEAGYAADIHSYHDYNDENNVAHTARANIDLDFSGGLKIDVDDTFTDSKDTRTETGAQRASHWTNNASSSIMYEFPSTDFSLEINGTQFYLEYDQEANKGVNRKEEYMGAAMYYKCLPKTSLFAEYQYGLIDYYDSIYESYDKDSKSHAVFGGLKWDATSKVSGTLKAGLKKKTFDNTYNLNGLKYKDKDIWAVSANLDYNALKTLIINLTANRSIEETEYGGNDLNSESSYYLNTGGSLGLTVTFLDDIDFESSLGLQNHEYEKLDTDSAKRKRKDDLINASTGFKYRIQEWLYARLNYSYKELDSNDNDRDEINNIVMFSVGAVL